MILNWAKKNAGVLVVPCIKSKKVIKHLRLLPGVNSTISEADWKQCEKFLNKHIERGDLIIVKGNKDKEAEPKKTKDGKLKEAELSIEKQKPAKGIQDLTIKEAKEIVKETFELESLEKYLDEEVRDEIRLLINKQIEKVNNPKKSD